MNGRNKTKGTLISIIMSCKGKCKAMKIVLKLIFQTIAFTQIFLILVIIVLQ